MRPGFLHIFDKDTIVGLRVGGVLGALAATAGCVAPACVLVTVLAKLYFKYRDMTYIHGTLSGLRPAIVALVAVAGVAIFKMAGETLSKKNTFGTKSILSITSLACFSVIDLKSR